MEEKDFIPIFKAETEEHIFKLEQGLVELEKNPKDTNLIIELNRQAHTLKGSARVLGFYEIQEIAHRIEEIFDRISRGEFLSDSVMISVILKGIDAVKDILAKIVSEERLDVDVSDICRELDNCIPHTVSGRDREQGMKAKRTPGYKEAETEYADEESITEDNKGKEKVSQEYQQDTKGNKQAVDSSARSIGLDAVDEYVRIPVARVNKLLNLAGEMVIHKMKTSQKIAKAKRLTLLAKDVQKKTSELRDIVRRSVLENSDEALKMFGQCESGLRKLREETQELYDKISMESFHLDPVIDELQSRMKEMRMLSCSTVFERFPRMIRDIAIEEKKEVRLKISGGETELDKKVLEGIKDPLMHILRNCVDHGIEDSQKRKSLGKPEYGTISLCAFHKGGNVVIVAEDDGAGIDVEEVRRTALKKRFVGGEDVRGMSDKEILNLVFLNGYSTSPIITDVSGRGIGLDIVRRQIEALKGQVFFESEKDKGTRFTLVLPLTVAIIQVLLVKVKGVIFAVPIAYIEENLKISKQDISTIEGKMAMELRGRIIPVVPLSEVLRIEQAKLSKNLKYKEDSQDSGELFMFIANSLDKRVGFLVDEIAGEDEVFIKSLGEHLGKITNVSGATIRPTGEVVVVLDVIDLISQSRLSHPAVSKRKFLSSEPRKLKKILVVEDALSARELEKKMLEGQGYSVDTAVDGLDGLDKIAQTKYDLIVADIKMPRMDGFELCRTLKSNDEYRNIPVIIVTSLDKEEDKRCGIEAGAAAYIVKTAFDQTNLFDVVERLI
ncbi:MAG: hybrid sensor histidine kinase/response regulator [Candidatus Omnitrophota bacterium]